jgi:hypothetical protein
MDFQVQSYRFIIPLVFPPGNLLYAVWLHSVCNTSGLVSTRSKTICSLLYDFIFFQKYNQIKLLTVLEQVI